MDYFRNLFGIGRPSPAQKTQPKPKATKGKSTEPKANNTKGANQPSKNLLSRAADKAISHSYYSLLPSKTKKLYDEHVKPGGNFDSFLEKLKDNPNLKAKVLSAILTDSKLNLTEDAKIKYTDQLSEAFFSDYLGAPQADADQKLEGKTDAQLQNLAKKQALAMAKRLGVGGLAAVKEALGKKGSQEEQMEALTTYWKNVQVSMRDKTYTLSRLQVMKHMMVFTFSLIKEATQNAVKDAGMLFKASKDLAIEALKQGTCLAIATTIWSIEALLYEVFSAVLFLDKIFHDKPTGWIIEVAGWRDEALYTTLFGQEKGENNTPGGIFKMMGMAPEKISQMATNLREVGGMVSGAVSAARSGGSPTQSVSPKEFKAFWNDFTTALKDFTHRAFFLEAMVAGSVVWLGELADSNQSHKIGDQASKVTRPLGATMEALSKGPKKPKGI
jgi:hypothetical protein